MTVRLAAALLGFALTGLAHPQHVGVANLMHVPLDCCVDEHGFPIPSYGWDLSTNSSGDGRPQIPWSCVRGSYYSVCAPVPASGWDTDDLDILDQS